MLQHFHFTLLPHLLYFVFKRGWLNPADWRWWIFKERSMHYVRLPVSLSFVMNVVPDDDVVQTGRVWPADCEDETSIKRSSQQLTHFTTLDAVRQERHTHRAAKLHTWIGMIYLYQHSVRRPKIVKGTGTDKPQPQVSMLTFSSLSVSRP